MRTTPGVSTTNIVVRNIGHGMAKNISFEFSAPLESTSGQDITELPYFKHGINFMAPQTDIPTVWDSYQNVVQNLRDKGLTEGITITSSYEDRNGESYETAWTANPLLLEGIGYSEYKGYEDQVQALEDQARTLERISESIDAVANRREEQESAEAARGQEKRDGQRYGGLGEDPIGTNK